MTIPVLVLCTHNSARSVLGEGMLNHWAKRLGKDVRGHSAGSAPRGRVNPLALEVLRGQPVKVHWGYLEAMDRPALQAALNDIARS